MESNDNDFKGVGGSLNRIAIKYLITILYSIVIVGFTFHQGLSYSTPAYKLYVYNLDKNNGYRIRLKNEETGWSKSVNIEAESCVVISRMEPGEYTIRTYKEGTSVGDYASFNVEDEDLCIRITSVTGGLELCNNTFCS